MRELARLHSKEPFSRETCSQGMVLNEVFFPQPDVGRGGIFNPESRPSSRFVLDES